MRGSKFYGVYQGRKSRTSVGCHEQKAVAGGQLEEIIEGTSTNMSYDIDGEGDLEAYGMDKIRLSSTKEREQAR